MESVGGGGELEVGKTPLSEFGGDRLKEMEKIHAMQENEVDHTQLGSDMVGPSHQEPLMGDT